MFNGKKKSREKEWKPTRDTFKQHREAKKAHIQAVRNVKKTQMAFEKKANKCLKASSMRMIRQSVTAVINAFSGKGQPQKITIDPESVIPAEFLEARDAHIEALEELEVSLKVMVKAEVDYAGMLCRILIDEYGFSYTQLAELFGVWDTNIREFFSVNPEDREKIYERHF